MLTTKELMKKALQHFPRWMNIRKRSDKSVGGQLVSSVAESTADIQDAINEYIEQYFIPYYEDKCEEIPDFVYKANIGIVDLGSLKILEPEYIITENIEEFYKNKELVYYQDGQLFVKEALPRLIYAIDEYANETILEKTHVWNVYDEFAAFVDIARFENETNQELYNRIIAVSKRVLNSSEINLKEAIIANLINIAPELEQKDIKLERPTAKNLAQTYKTFGTILDYLADINKDVMRTKNWDLDKWNNDFKSIDYIPHTWDIALDEITNGIGDGDDLKPVFIDAITSTDVDLSFYEKSLASVDSYIRDNNMTDTLELSLTKYNDSLNSSEVGYTITASEASEIITTESTMPIIVELYETVKGEHNRRVEELIEDEYSYHNIDIKKNGKLEKDKFYKVRFTPKDKYSTMEIYKCNAVDEMGVIYEDDDGTSYDFLAANGDFIFDGNKLYNNLVKRSVNKLTQCARHNNVKDIGTGLTIDKINSNATFSVDLKDCAGESLKIVHDCEMSYVLPQDIVTKNFYYEAATSSYLSDAVGDEKSLTINIMANEFSMRVKQGHCQVIAIINNKQQVLSPTIEDGEYIYSTERFSSPQEMNIIVTLVNFSQQAIVTNIQYSNYEIIASVDSGVLTENTNEKDLYWTPAYYENALNITMSTKTQYAPVIKKIFVGRELDELNAYETGLIQGKDDMYMVISSNCNVELYECDEPFQDCNKDAANQIVTRDYNTDKIYTATSNDAYIILNTSMYTNIESIVADNGTCEATGVGTTQKFVIKLINGQSVSKVTIVGHYNEVVACNTIHELIKNEMPDYDPYIMSEDNFFWYEGHKLYANKALKCFVVSNPYGVQKQVRLSINSFKLNNVDNISKAIIYNVPENLETAFSSADTTAGQFTTIGLVHEGIFDNLYIYPKNANSYVAKNECITYSEIRDDIEIVNTFNNGYVDNKLMVYTIRADKPDLYEVTFQDDKDWSIDKKKIKVKLKNMDDYNISKKTITDKIALGSIVSLKEYYTDENKEQIELAQYIIDTDDKDYTVSYKSDINDISYDKAEFIIVKDDRFNKLRYSNIACIKYIGYEVYDSENQDLIEIDSSEYTFNAKKGIIEWHKNCSAKSGTKLYVLYSIKKPISIKFNIDALYKKAQYPIAAYNRIGRYKLKNIEHNSKINLANPLVGDIDLAKNIAADYKNSNVVYAQCKEAGFKADKSGDIITIKKIAETNSLAVKSGWYYMLGKEYYMFATDQNTNIVNDEYVSMNEVDKIDLDLHLHKKTTNYIKNSKMSLGSLANSYNVTNFEDIKSFKGASTMNSITACDSYNYWHTFGMNLGLVKGLNGLGLNFIPEHESGYAILDITKYSPNNSHISFYNPNGLLAYIGKERLIKDISLTDTISISAIAQITKSINDINVATFKKEEGYKYYLIIRGQGVIDDIIIQDEEDADLELHTKNISNLNLEINETITSGVVSRVMIDQSKGNKNNGGEINSEGYIINSSNIDWNITKLKEYTSYNDWFTGWSLENVDVTKINDKDCAITTGSTAGKIETKPIYIGDPSTINSIVFKINDVPLTSMQGFTVQLLQAKTKNGSYVPCKLKYNNNNNLNYSNSLTYSYVKLSVDIPSNKVIGNIEIYLEYKSTDNAAPVERINTNGEYITEVLDTHHSSTYKLKDILIEDAHGKSQLFIRASREGASMQVWSEWHEIIIEDGKIANNIVFEDYRFFQLRAKLSGKNSKIKIKHFDLEVMK